VELSDTHTNGAANEMRRIKLQEWLFPFLVFLMILSFGSLRKLHAVGQPISDLVIDALGAGFLFALAIYILDKRSPS
jgi:hypothetical protein